MTDSNCGKRIKLSFIDLNSYVRTITEIGVNVSLGQCNRCANFQLRRSKVRIMDSRI